MAVGTGAYVEVARVERLSDPSDARALGLTSLITGAVTRWATAPRRPAGWPADRGVHYLVDDVPAAVVMAELAGCAVREAPFDIAIGRCAVLADPFGNPVSVLDLSKGPRVA